MHRHADLGQEPARQREANAHHAGRVILDALDEPVTEPVRGERTGHPGRLDGSQRAIDLSRRRHRNQTRTGTRLGPSKRRGGDLPEFLPLWLAVTRYGSADPGLTKLASAPLSSGRRS